MHKSINFLLRRALTRKLGLVRRPNFRSDPHVYTNSKNSDWIPGTHAHRTLTERARKHRMPRRHFGIKPENYMNTNFRVSTFQVATRVALGSFFGLN